MDKKTGSLLILAGVVMLVFSTGMLRFGTMMEFIWPFFIIIPGLMFHNGFFNRRPKGVGLLIPGGILLTVGLVCLVSTITNGWEVTWPGFVLAPAIGFFEFYYFGRRNKVIFVIASCIAFLAAVFFLTISLPNMSGAMPYIIPAALIFCGAVILMKDNEEKEELEENMDYLPINNSVKNK